MSADFSVGRGGQGGAPKKQFAQKLAGFAGAQSQTLPVALDSLHQRIRGATSAAPLFDLLDQYVAVLAQIAATYPPAPFVPQGSVLAAAMAAVGSNGGG